MALEIAYRAQNGATIGINGTQGVQEVVDVEADLHLLADESFANGVAGTCSAYAVHPAHRAEGTGSPPVSLRQARGRVISVCPTGMG